MYRCFAVIVLGVLAAVATPLAAALAEEEKQLSGTIEIDEAQMAFIFSGTAGSGVLHYQGKSYDFSIGGAGLGGIGISKVTATGEVYDLKSIDDFPGVYGRARAGAVAGDKSTGGLWLENTSGVYLRLQAEREGLALSLGADGLLVEMKE